NNLITSYSGTVQFTSTDAQAMRPPNSPLTNGTGNFAVTFKTIANQTITATDIVKPSITGISSSISVVSNAATHFSVNSPGSATIGAAFQFTVSALDAANNVSAGYSGTVKFTSTDAKAMLPANSMLVPGTYYFFATLETADMQTITATDTVTASIAGTSSPISVAAPAKLSITSAAPPNGTVDVAYDIRHESCVKGSPGCRCVLVGLNIYYCYKYPSTSGFTLTATGGVPPYGWSWAPAVNSSLPPGLNLATRGLISGTPTSVGSYNVIATVTDSSSPAAQTSTIYTLTVAPPPPPAVSTTPPPSPGVVNLAYTFTFSASGASPFTWSESGALPSGLAFDNSSGTLSGTPTQTGSFPISVTAIDQFNQNSTPASFTIVVSVHGFVATGSMATARRFHTATLLGNGKVLVAGGEDDGATAFSSAELYDPSAGTFSPTGSMTVPRVGHTATVLSNGKVLITGGATDASENALSSAELYDPVTGTFSAITVGMTTARVSHTATLLQDGRVLVAGGDTIFFNGVQNTSIQSLASAEIFDPSMGTFTSTANMNAARETHTATLLNDGTVLIAGGSDGALGNSTPAATVYSSAELFNPSTLQFTPAGSMSTERDFFTATLLGNGTVLISGGTNTTDFLASADLFDPTSTSFSPTGNLTAPRFYHDASALNDGTVLLSGGSDANNRALATAEIYDPTGGSFAITGSMISARVWHTATVLQNGKVLVTGGADTNSTPLATAELYQ